MHHSLNTDPSNKGTTILKQLYGSTDIMRVDASSITAHQITHNYLFARRPLIVRGLTDHWPALKTWSFEYFERRFGNIYTNVFAGGNEAESQQIRLKAMFARMREGEVLYSSLYLVNMLPLLQADYPVDGTMLGDSTFNWLLDLPKVQGEMNVVFIGNSGTGIKNHQDSMGSHLWSAQICGCKRWWVGPPEMTPFFAEGQASWLTPEQSAKAHPKFAEAACVDFVLEPGEVLFLPVGWWHQTAILENSISITQDIVNASNFEHFASELIRNKQDPKIKSFEQASEGLRTCWRKRLPKRATQQIERISSEIDFDQLLHQYLIPHKPVVLQGQIDHWPALSKWSINYFKGQFGDVFIQYFAKRDDKSRWMRLRKFFETSFEKPHYMMWCLDSFAHLIGDDIQPLSLLDNNEKDWTFDLPDKERNALTWLFMGLKGSGIGNHADRLGQHVYSAQVVGRKRWLLHSPQDERWLKKEQDNVDIIEPDYVHFPLYIRASPVFDFVLEPGEVLILPDGWWHQTVTLEDSISLSHDFVNISNIQSFLKRLQERRGTTHMESDEMRPVLRKWAQRRKCGTRQTRGC